MKYIQQQIRQIRESKGLTQSTLGARIGQPQSAVSRIEGGGDLRVSTLLEITRVLQMEPMLIPKHLIPAVRALVDHGSAGTGAPDTGGTRLVGRAPEDAPEDAKDSE